MDERVAQYYSLDSWLFWPTVRWFPVNVLSVSRSATCTQHTPKKHALVKMHSTKDASSSVDFWKRLYVIVVVVFVVIIVAVVVVGGARRTFGHS